MIGGGFIGSEIAAALAMNDCTVTIVFPDAGIGAKVFPADLSLFVNDYYRSKGVEVLPGREGRRDRPRGRRRLSRRDR